LKILEGGDPVKAYIAIKYHTDSRNRPLIEALSAVLAEAGAGSLCIARDVEGWGRVRLDPAALMERSFAEIDASDFLLVDLTEKGVGIGIEAGYARARGIPVLTVAREGSDVSETLRGISREVHLYEDPADLRAALEKWISRLEAEA
jgi:nucleoside 2-deoxyribosyltransferase